MSGKKNNKSRFFEFNRKVILKIIFYIIFIYLFFGVVGLFFSDRIIFYQPKSSYSESAENLLKIEGRDGREISAMYMPAEKSEVLFIFSHGNAEDIGQVRPFFEILNTLGYSVLGFDYQGYGLNSGRATEKNVYEDVTSVYEYAVDELEYEPRLIIPYGRSIGAAVVTELATRKPVGGLVLESGFTSVFRVLTKVPLYPFDKFNNLKKIKKLQIPVFILHGRKDEIIGFWNGKKLYKAANEPKIKMWIDKAGHNDMIMHMGNEYFDKLENFVETVKNYNKEQY